MLFLHHTFLYAATITILETRYLLTSKKFHFAWGMDGMDKM
jgi:hypothetical protein